MDVAEIMTADVVTITADQTVREAIETLEALQVRHLPVVDDGRLVGMISDRDLRQFRRVSDDGTEDAATHELAVSRIMETNVLTLDTAETVKTAIDMILEYGVGALPVVDRHNDQLVGIASYIDILKALRSVA